MGSAVDTSKSKAQFDRDGYILLRGFFSPDEMAEIRRHAQRTIESILQLPENAAKYEVKDRPETLKQLQLSGYGDAYWDDLLHDPRVMQLAEALLGDTVVPRTLQWLNKPIRVGAETPPHQDGYYYMLEPNEAIALWLALDPATPENGCMRYVPGSNRRPLRAHARTNTLGFSQGVTDYGDADYETEAAISAEPGDAIAHHSLTIHRADPNLSALPRRALQFVYFATRAREDVARKAAYQQELHSQLQEAGKI